MSFCFAGGVGKWSEEGCSMTRETNTHVTCACNHLSSFAVIQVSIVLAHTHTPSILFTYILVFYQHKIQVLRDCSYLESHSISHAVAAVLYATYSTCLQRLLALSPPLTHPVIPLPYLTHPGSSRHHGGTCHFGCDNNCSPSCSCCPRCCSTNSGHCGSNHIHEVRALPSFITLHSCVHV